MSGFRPGSDDYPLTDNALTVFLARGDAALLRHVRAHSHLGQVLGRLLEPGAETKTGSFPVPSAGASRESGHGAEKQVRVLALAEVVVLDRVRGDARVLADDVVESLEVDGDPDSLFAYVRDQISVHRLVGDLDLAVDLALDLDDALEGRLTDRLAGARTMIRDIIDGSGSARAVARCSGLARETEAALDLARSVVHDLFGEVIDVAGLDLALLDRAALHYRDADEIVRALAGVVWDEATRWHWLQWTVTASSEEVSPGVFRVRDGTERSP
ncbi:hypothetical protein ACQEU6_14620 [Spirillospora sp. CA-108201]